MDNISNLFKNIKFNSGDELAHSTMASAFILAARSGRNVEIVTNSLDTADLNDTYVKNTWKFDVFGNLTLPVNGDILNSNGTSIVNKSGSSVVFTGNLTGNVTGNVTGNLTGNLTGNVTGNVTGNLTGNVTGNINRVTITQPTHSATLTLADNSTFITSGAYTTTITSTNTTNVTLPTSGTLATIGGSESLTGKTYNGLTVSTTTGTLTISNSKTLSVSNTLTFTGTDSSSVAFGTGGTVAYTANKLNVFASTSSSELAGIISDETGTGSLVFSASPTFTGTPLAPTASAGTCTTQIATTAYVRQEVANLVASAPTALDTLNELATALGNDASFSTTVTTALGTKAPINNPTFTGTVGGITATMVGLGNVTNESKSTMFTNPTFTGTVAGVTATHVGLGNVTNESKSTMFTSPTFTGTTTLQQTVEKFASPSISANAVTLDFTTGAIYALGSNGANITANFTNVPTTSGQAITAVLVISQGATAYIPSTVNINSNAQTIKWLGGSAPSGNANKTDIVTLTFVCTATSTYTVIASLASYG
jgi:hypothetical protein